jgi:hypothetical protein
MLSESDIRKLIDEHQQSINEHQQSINELQIKLEYMINNCIPRGFVVDDACKSLTNPKCLEWAFSWFYTPQGWTYWSDICNGKTELSKDDILQIQKWIINYYRHHQN